MRWWWNLTATGKLLVLATVASLAGLGWALAREAQQPAGSAPLVGTLPTPSPTAPSPVPTFLPTPTPTPTQAPSPTPTPRASPTPSPTPPRSPTPTAPVRVIESVRILYTTCEGDGACGTMASGLRVHPGAAACNPTLAPFGTRLRILGWDQELVCEDIHPTLQGWYVVVWFATEAEGRAFRQRVGNTATVEVLYMPPR